MGVLKIVMILIFLNLKLSSLVTTGKKTQSVLPWTKNISSLMMKMRPKQNQSPGTSMLPTLALALVLCAISSLPPSGFLDHHYLYLVSYRQNTVWFWIRAGPSKSSIHHFSNTFIVKQMLPSQAFHLCWLLRTRLKNFGSCMRMATWARSMKPCWPLRVSWKHRCVQLWTHWRNSDHHTTFRSIQFRCGFETITFWVWARGLPDKTKGIQISMFGK